MKKIIITMSVAVVVLAGCGTDTKDIFNKDTTNEVFEHENSNSECKGNVCSVDLATFETLSPEEFKQKNNSGEYIIIDIRTEEEHQAEKIDTEQLNIDIYKDDFNEKMNKLEKDNKYLIYCRSGSRSKIGLERMQELGFSEVYDLGGGIIAWKAVGFEII